MSTALPKCTSKGCAWRWHSGPDRPCALHADDAAADGIAQRMAAMAEVMGPPGETVPMAAVDGGTPEGGG